MYWCQKTRTNSTTGTMCCCCDNNLMYEELLQSIMLPTLHTWWLLAIAIIMRKVKNGLAPPYIMSRLVTNSQKFWFRFWTVAQDKHSLTYLGLVIWSKLDKSIKFCLSGSLYIDTLKSASNWIILQAYWTVLVKTNLLTTEREGHSGEYSGLKSWQLIGFSCSESCHMDRFHGSQQI